MNREMRELASKKGEEALATTVSVATPTSCLSSSNWEDYGSLLPNQVKHACIQLGLASANANKLLM